MKILNFNVGWYDVKTKLRKVVRSVFYLKITRFLVCLMVFLYLQFVFLTSRVRFIGFESSVDAVKDGRSVVFSFWHNRLLLLPFINNYLKKKSRTKFELMSLSSKHGDGQFVGTLAELFGFKNIAGSTRDGRKSSRGIDVSSMRGMIKSLRRGCSLGITPDGPKGPNQKINSQIIEMAKISRSCISPLSCSSSRFIEINSWDRLKIPLPFSKIVFFAGDLRLEFK